MCERLIAGVDEVGRGPLAGPVVCAAVILSSNDPCYHQYRDSKKLSEKKRLYFYRHLRKHTVAYSLAQVAADQIDQINILQATLQCMQHAVISLKVRPDHVLIDGNQLPDLPIDATAVIGGDDSEPCIAAASIIAKVVRDRLMAIVDVRYPGYGFSRHKGYGTKQHMLALQSLGPSPIHRYSFAPVARAAKSFNA